MRILSDDFKGTTYFGVLIGRYGNRIAKVFDSFIVIILLRK